MAILGTAIPAAADSSACKSMHPVFKARGTLASISAKLARHEAVRILAIGSSSTEGVGATKPDLAYPAQLEGDLADLWHEKVTVVNAGIGGETATRTVERLETTLKEGGYDLVIWQVGTNDAVNGVAEENFRKLLERGITAAKDARIDLILLDQQYFPTIKDLPRYEKFVQAVGSVGDERQVSVFSRYTLMKEWGAQSFDALRAMLAADSFHMSDKGYDCLANRVAEEIRTMAGVPVADPGGRAIFASAGR